MAGIFHRAGGRMVNCRALSIASAVGWSIVGRFPSRRRQGGQLRGVFHRHLVNRHFLVNYPAFSIDYVVNQEPVSINLTRSSRFP